MEEPQTLLSEPILSESDHNLAYKLQLEEAINASITSLPSSKRPRLDLDINIPDDDDDDDEDREHDELATAILSESDHNLAYKLQLEEAITASITSLPSSKRPRLDLDINIPDDDEDREHDELDLRIHDRAFARDLLVVHDYERVLGSEKINSEEFRLYCKGLVSEEMIGNERKVLAGIGVAICDSSGEIVIFKMQKPLVLREISVEIAEVKALIEGLNAAVTLGLKRITVFCEDNTTYQYVTRRWSPKQDKFAVLLNKVEILQKKFTYCEPSFVARNEFKFAIKLAREAIVSQTNNHAESSGTKIESCVICLEDVDVGQIFSVDDCMHRYCFSCMKQHVEVKLLNAIVPKCPHEGCTSVLKLDSCQKFLSPKLFEIMSERLAEAAIPVSEKIYCPYPRCSSLMSRSDILENSKTVLPDGYKRGARQCIKCLGLFCVNCKVPWHNNMTCYAYKKNNFNQQAEDINLKTLAAKNLWRQCVKCNHMIELAKGCYHMTCRCGYEFCYTCGAEWKDKKATCTCPLWDDENIMDDDYDDDDDGEFVEDDGYYDSDSDDNY